MSYSIYAARVSLSSIITSSRPSMHTFVDVLVTDSSNEVSIITDRNDEAVIDNNDLGPFVVGSFQRLVDPWYEDGVIYFVVALEIELRETLNEMGTDIVMEEE